MRVSQPSAEQLESGNSDALRKAREQMLGRIETYTSAQIAARMENWDGRD
jgi:hypothetical protein